MQTQRQMLVIGLLITIVLIPSVAAFDTTAVVGSTVFLDMTMSDPELAALVGLATYEVSWFNGVSLFSRNVPSGEQNIYAVAQGAPTPVGQTLTATGVTYPFTDPSGVAWTVAEKTYVVSGTTHYVYTTPVGVTTDGTATSVPSGGLYNFVLVVNTDSVHLGTNVVSVYIGA
jgi:hypothetical protein